MTKSLCVPICSLLLCFSVLFAGVPPPAQAAGYPERPVTLLVPYAPGAVTDLGARALAEAMEKDLKKAFTLAEEAMKGRKAYEKLMELAA